MRTCSHRPRTRCGCRHNWHVCSKHLSVSGMLLQQTPGCPQCMECIANDHNRPTRLSAQRSRQAHQHSDHHVIPNQPSATAPKQSRSKSPQTEHITVITSTSSRSNPYLHNTPASRALSNSCIPYRGCASQCHIAPAPHTVETATCASCNSAGVRSDHACNIPRWPPCRTATPLLRSGTPQLHMKCPEQTASRCSAGNLQQSGAGKCHTHTIPLSQFQAPPQKRL